VWQADLPNGCVFFLRRMNGRTAHKAGGKIQIIQANYWTMPIELGYLQKSGFLKPDFYNAR
jgi:hypothetical protein